MAIELDKLNILKIDKIKSNLYLFNIDNNKYWFKTGSFFNLINELISGEFADLYGINHVEYKLASYDGFYGVLSNNIDNYTTLDKIYDLNGINNNIYNIGNLLIRNLDINTVNKMIDQLYNIFIFDMIIANSDRNSSNILINSNSIGPIFDNELAFNHDYMYDGSFSLYIDFDDINNYDGVVNFLNKANLEYIELFKEKLSLFNDDNINKCINSFVNKYPEFNDSKFINYIYTNISTNVNLLKRKMKTLSKR